MLAAAFLLFRLVSGKDSNLFEEARAAGFTVCMLSFSVIMIVCDC
jgi:hypothetical protein